MTHLVCFPSSFRYPLFTTEKKPLPLRFLAYSEPQLIFCLRICGISFIMVSIAFRSLILRLLPTFFLRFFGVVFVPIMMTFCVVVVVVVLGFPLSRPFLLQSVFSGCSKEHFLLVFFVIFSYLAASSDLFLRFFGFDFVPTMMTFVFLLLF